MIATTLFGVLSLLCAIALCGPAFAQPAKKAPPKYLACNAATTTSVGGKEFRCTASSKLDDHQYSYTWVAMKGDGTGSIMSKFSNGHRVDGDNFQSFIFFLDSAKSPVLVVKQAKGVNASGGGKTVERNARNAVRLSAADWQSVDSVVIRHTKRGRCDDQTIWRNIGGTAAKAVVTTPEPTKVVTEVAKTAAIQLVSCRK